MRRRTKISLGGGRGGSGGAITISLTDSHQIPPPASLPPELLFGCKERPLDRQPQEPIGSNLTFFAMCSESSPEVEEAESSPVSCGDGAVTEGAARAEEATMVSTNCFRFSLTLFSN
jgi:hypothetical protein